RERLIRTASDSARRNPMLRGVRMKRVLHHFFVCVALTSAVFAQQRPVHTFSIVARDPATGELGVAVQSHWFCVGSVVPWAEAGVGAVATQSFVDPSYGKL